MYSKIKRWYCPKCDRRLWHSSSTKNFSFYSVLLDNKKDTEQFRSTRSGLVLASQEINIPTAVDLVDQFFCGEHGRLRVIITNYD